MESLAIISANLSSWQSVDISQAFDIQSLVTKYIDDELRHNSEIIKPTWLSTLAIRSLLKSKLNIDTTNSAKSGFVNPNASRTIVPGVLIADSPRSLKSNIEQAMRVVYKLRYNCIGLPDSSIDPCDWTVQANSVNLFNYPRIYYFIVNVSEVHWVAVVVEI